MIEEDRKKPRDKNIMVCPIPNWRP